MNDVHYYIPSLPAVPNLWLLISGLMFEGKPGRYPLPCNEGQYAVYSNDECSMINMRTNGTSHTYTHPNVSFKRCDIVVDYGFLRFFTLKTSCLNYNTNAYVHKRTSNDSGSVMSAFLLETLSPIELESN